MVQETPSTAAGASEPSFPEEVTRCWKALPGKGLFFTLFACWFALFWFLGNPTLGYVDSPAILGWLKWVYDRAPDDSHGQLIPFVVLVLFWLKRKELLELPNQPWWPGTILLALALGLHIVGYTIQQPQVCLVAFLAGIYALMGIAWGWPWLKTTFFPTFLFAFCVPVSNVIVPLTFPLRMAATNITTALCNGLLGVGVRQNGTTITDALGQYQYEVAAACSGIRSLTAITAIALIYAFVSFKKPWQRALLIASALPLAVLSNVVRLSSIIVAAEAFGQKAGDWVHNSWWAGLLPYVPAIAGMFLLGHLLARQRRRRKAENGRGLTSPATEVEVV
jgi:exosortase